MNFTALLTSSHSLQPDDMTDEKPTDTKEQLTTTSSESTATPAAWTKQYDLLAKKLPDGISNRLPTSTEAQAALNTVSTTLTEKYGQAATATKQFSETSKANYSRLSAQSLTKQAWSITNETQVPINVALGQVGPLMYEVSIHFHALLHFVHLH